MQPRLMVINYDQFWKAWELLQQNVKVSQAGSLWVILVLNQVQTQILANHGIHARIAYP